MWAFFHLLCSVLDYSRFQTDHVLSANYGKQICSDLDCRFRQFMYRKDLVNTPFRGMILKKGKNIFSHKKKNYEISVLLYQKNACVF